MKILFLALGFLLAFAPRAPAVTYVWQMQASEDQVNNSGEGDGSTDSAATGDVYIEYTAATGFLHYEISWNNLESWLTKIHLHGPAWATETVMPHLWNVFAEEEHVIAAGVDRTTDSYQETVLLTEIVPGPSYLVTPGILQHMVDERGYMNFHTMRWPGGEIRAQLVLKTENVPVTGHHKRCIDGMQRVRERALRVGQRHAEGCLAEKAASPNTTTLGDCLVADSKETLHAADLVEDAFQRACWGFGGAGYLRFPAFGGGRVARIQAFARSQGISLLDDLLGADPDGAVIAASLDSSASRCQAAVLDAAGGCGEAIQREFRRCTRKGFAGKQGPLGADLPFDDPADMERCLGDDPSGRIERACDQLTGPTDRLRRRLEKRCTGQGVDLATAFPGCAASDAEGLHACVLGAVRCRACQVVQATTDDLTIDCDSFDDAANNASCGS